jgi:VIT1/CCC1 family predicted Fe2+/Mn2+ transporter
MPPSPTKQYLENLTDERNSAALYRTLADIEKNPKIAEVYRRLAATEDAHAATWAEKLKAANVAVPPLKLGWRTRTLIWAAHRFGPSAVLPSMAAMENRGTHSYTQQGAPAGMAAQEKSHAMLMQTISQSARGGMEGPALAKLEGRHRSAGGNALRAAVLGANDGLVSNFSLVMGVAGAEVNNSTIVLTGVAGLLAGAISMALGEWVSVQSSRELYQKQIRTEKEEIATNPAEEAEELSLIYQARGLEESAARQLAQQIMSNEEGALEALSRWAAQPGKRRSRRSCYLRWARSSRWCPSSSPAARPPSSSAPSSAPSACSALARLLRSSPAARCSSPARGRCCSVWPRRRLPF